MIVFNSLVSTQINFRMGVTKLFIWLYFGEKPHFAPVSRNSKQRKAMWDGHVISKGTT